MTVLAAAQLKGPHIDWDALSPLLALFGGGLFVLLVGLLRSRFVLETLVPLLTIAALGAFLGLSIWQWGDDTSIMSGALRIDELTLYLNFLFAIGGIAAVLLSWRSAAPREA